VIHHFLQEASHVTKGRRGGAAAAASRRHSNFNLLMRAAHSTEKKAGDVNCGKLILAGRNAERRKWLS
jgi:hypothetical protein